VMALTGGLAAWWRSQEMDRATKFAPADTVTAPFANATDNPALHNTETPAKAADNPIPQKTGN